MSYHSPLGYIVWFRLLIISSPLLQARMAEEYENADFVALQEKHSAAMGTIVSLKANIDELNEQKVDQAKIDDMEASLEKMTEKNIELSQMVE